MGLCISVLAATDTIVLIIALFDYLTDEANVSIVPSKSPKNIKIPGPQT